MKSKFKYRGKSVLFRFINSVDLNLRFYTTKTTKLHLLTDSAIVHIHQFGFVLTFRAKAV